MFVLNGDILLKIAPKMGKDLADKIADLLTEVCPLYGINSADILHEFLANLLHESGEFTHKTEVLNYTPKRLMQVWPARFRDYEKALKYSQNQKLLAEEVYGNRRDLGNIQAGDGWRFRGSGFIQMTGRLNFVAFASYMRQKFNIVKPLDVWADELRNNDVWALHSACYIFAVSMSLIKAALANNMAYVVKRINGGTIGLDERLHYYELCKKHIK